MANNIGFLVDCYAGYVEELGDEEAEWCLRQCYDDDVADAVLNAYERG
ncbi:hypothetical protein ACFWMR_02105 [Amycolatopsis thailandensis]